MHVQCKKSPWNAYAYVIKFVVQEHEYDDNRWKESGFKLKNNKFMRSSLLRCLYENSVFDTL